MITLDDVRAHFAESEIAGDWTDERVSAVLAAERSAQRSVLDLPSPRPAEADDALLRRVVHNLTTSTAKDVERIGINADGVRDLERPWSRRREREEPSPEPTPKPRRKRAAKKTAAASAATNTKENR